MIASVVTMGKDLVALLRDAALLAIAVLLVLSPTTFNGMMVDAGFEEGSIVGFKWKAKLIASDQELKDAQGTIQELQGQNQKLTQTLSQAKGYVSDSDLKTRISDLEVQTRGIEEASQMVAEAVKATIASNAPLVEKAQAAIEGNTTWGVVYGGDTTLEGAQYEVGPVARQLGMNGAAIYYRRGSYRSVVVVQTKADADAVLAKAKDRRPDAYVVSMATWCPRPGKKEGYWDCASPSA